MRKNDIFVFTKKQETSKKINNKKQYVGKIFMVYIDEDEQFMQCKMCYFHNKKFCPTANDKCIIMDYRYIFVDITDEL